MERAGRNSLTKSSFSLSFNYLLLAAALVYIKEVQVLQKDAANLMKFLCVLL